MPKIEGIDKALSFTPSKKLGRNREYGRGMFAEAVYGEENDFIEYAIYGVSSYGEEKYGNRMLVSGIFRKDGTTAKGGTYLEPYYIPYDPKSEDQLARRGVFGDGVDAWHALTDNERAEYNEKAKGKHRSGFNAFLRQYLLSH